MTITKQALKKNENATINSKFGQVIIIPLVALLLTSTFFGNSLDQDHDAYSQSFNTNSTANTASSGVDLINIHPSPSDVKAGNTFELLATVINNSTDTIMLPAGVCDSPLTAFFMANVVIRQDQFQGCTAPSSPFELKQGEEVTVAGPVPGTLYQAIKAGKTPATATVYYLTENMEPGNVTKSFVFTIS
ncbi:MAG: hypothetical protein P0116_09280 [Candidatus Nitrosocosmicus sp.]|nr:hypothetical protein [Candidatus Nitrosocosmicus sp.]